MIQDTRCLERNCKNYIGVIQSDRSETNEVNICKAFPEGIPDFIAYGDNLHLKPVEGDNGIQYEKA